MVQRHGRCLNVESGEIEVWVKMPSTRGQTERPREPLLQLGIGKWSGMCSIGGRRRSVGVSLRGATGEIPPLPVYFPKGIRDPDFRHCQAGSLTGAVASKMVTEAREGHLGMVGNHPASAKAQGGLTARPTSRAGTKVGLSDLAVASGSAVT